jgi:hypothetical protein
MALGDDNRTPKEDSSADSPLLKAFNNSSSNSTSQPQQIPHDDSTMPPWAILLIVAISIVSLAIQKYNKYFPFRHRFCSFQLELADIF